MTPNLWLSASAQTTTANPGNGTPRGTTLETVRVLRESGSDINIVIATKDETAPWVETLPDPARIVVDLPNTVLKTGLGPIVIGTNGVKGVRIGTDAAKTTRVVVDLARLCKYELVRGSDHRLILKLDPTSPAPALAATPSAPVQSAPLLPSQSPPSQSAAGTRNQQRLAEPTFLPKHEAPAANATMPSRDATRKFQKPSEGKIEPPSQPAEIQPSLQAVSPPTPPPPPPTLEQLPPRPPQVTWDGNQLSIKSENSTLADILATVRKQIKTEIDIPYGAGQERVAVDLGPGPPREVLTSLLSGSNFDYIIQASDSDENALQVLLMPRGNSDGVSGTAVASTQSGEGNDKDTGSGSMASSGAVRRGPGYSPSGKPAFQEQTPLPDQESASTPDPQTAPIPKTTEPAAASVDSNQPAAQPVAETPATSQDASPVAASLGGSNPGGGNPLVIQSTPVTAGAVVGPPPTTAAEMTDELQRMYEMRRQMQQQQNQGTTPPQPQP